MTTLIEQKIFVNTLNHTLSPITDYCKAEKEDCRLKSGHEVTFISLLSERIFQHLQIVLDQNITYNQWIYMPSRRAEKNIGYDLSVGKYNESKRVRTMNKLLLRWCDNVRSWSLKIGSKDHNHFLALYEDWKKSEDSRNYLTAYLVINICYCIHEYRRMGEIIGNLVIPDTDSILRTIVIPLTPFFFYIFEGKIAPNNVEFKYSRISNSRLLNETDDMFINRISELDNHKFTAKWNENSRDLEILSLDIFLDRLLNFINRH